jgi:hypothetical protein
MVAMGNVIDTGAKLGDSDYESRGDQL